MKSLAHEAPVKRSRSAAHEVARLQISGGNKNHQIPRPSEAHSGATVQQKANHTGLPDGLKSGIESLSGYSMDDVKVHYNSPKPAQLKAHAFAQGSEIHIGAGQERHLPHEAWHVVQQKQGRVQPTRQFKKIHINDSPALEKEATIMGNKSREIGQSFDSTTRNVSSPRKAMPDLKSVSLKGDVSQMEWTETKGNEAYWNETNNMSEAVSGWYTYCGDNVFVLNYRGFGERKYIYQNYQLNPLKNQNYQVGQPRPFEVPQRLGGAYGRPQEYPNEINFNPTLAGGGLHNQGVFPNPHTGKYPSFVTDIATKKNIATNIGEDLDIQGDFGSAFFFIPEPELKKKPSDLGQEPDHDEEDYEDYDQEESEGEEGHEQIDDALSSQDSSSEGSQKEDQIISSSMKIKKKSDRVRKQLHRGKDGEVKESKDQKQVWKHITKKSILYAKRNPKRPKSQNQVMGGSANVEARKHNYTTENAHQDWEWLHMVASSMDKKWAQQKGNLVLGTKQANSWMMPLESAVKKLVETKDQTLNLFVSCKMTKRNPIGIIEYRITNPLNNRIAQYKFNAMTAKAPPKVFFETNAIYTALEDQLFPN